MKLNCIKTLPDTIYIAFSGGIDSVVMADVAVRLKRKVKLAFYNHGNELADREEEFVKTFAHDRNFELIVGRNTEQQVGSKEKFWRDCRYRFFKSLPGAVATGHHLDDAVEWYLMTCLRGRGEFMEYSHASIIRPLILSSKSDITEYAEFHSLPYFNDVTNEDSDFTARNKVRHEILPKCLEVNAGLYNVVRKRIFEKTFP